MVSTWHSCNPLAYSANCAVLQLVAALSAAVCCCVCEMAAFHPEASAPLVLHYIKYSKYIDIYFKYKYIHTIGLKYKYKYMYEYKYQCTGMHPPVVSERVALPVY